MREEKRRRRPLLLGGLGAVLLIVIAGVGIKIAAKDGKKPAKNVPEKAVVSAENAEQSEKGTKDLHRRAAELVVGRGGFATIVCSDGSVARVHKIIDLPREPFVLRDVYLHGQWGFSDADVGAIGGLSYLSDIGLSMTGVTDRAVGYLRKIGGTHIDLTGTAVGNAGIQELLNRDDLRSLLLGGTHITDTACLTLAQLPNLRGLKLHQTAIGDAGLKHLAALKALSRLEVGPNCTVAGLPPLKAIESLQWLHLHQVPIRPEDVKTLAEFTQLRVLYLDGSVSDDLATEIEKALSNAKVIHPGLPADKAQSDALRWAIDAKSTVLGEDSKKLASVPPSAFHAHTLIAENLTGADAAALRGFRGLQSLIWHASQGADALADSIVSLSSLKLLALPRSDLSDIGLEHPSLSVTHSCFSKFQS